MVSMNYLFLLKRFEIWMLLGIVVSLLVFAFQPVEEETTDGEDSSGEVVVEMTVDPGTGIEEPEEASPVPEALIVRDVRVEPTEQGRVVELTLLAHSNSEESVEVTD